MAHREGARSMRTLSTARGVAGLLGALFLAQNRQGGVYETKQHSGLVSSRWAGHSHFGQFDGIRDRNCSSLESRILMKALRHGWNCLMQDSAPLAYKYSTSFGAVLIAGLFTLAVAVSRAAFKKETGI